MEKKEIHKKKDIIYLTLIVLTFALFFITFVALYTAEDRCFSQFDNAMQVISDDTCMHTCLSPTIYDSLNYTNLQIKMEVYNATQ